MLQRVLRSNLRCLTTIPAPLVVTSFDHATKVATLTMAKPPVNSLSLEMCHEMSSAIHAIEADTNINSLLLKSSSSSIFSAGLDINEMHHPDPVRLADFWRAIQQIFLDVYGSRLAVVAGIEAHSPAGGCLLAMCADYRVMASDPKFKIGLNETNLGIAAPYWLGELFVRTIGFREAESGLALAKLYSPQEALKINLVDEIVDQADVLDVAKAHAVQWAKIPPLARSSGKMNLRSPYINELILNREKDIDDFCSFILTDNVQKSLDVYMEALSKRGKK